MKIFKTGDFVVSDRHGHKGRVTSFDFRHGESEEWLDIQEPPLTEEERKGLWVHILCDGSGSVVVPAESCHKVEPFPYTNPCAGETFEYKPDPIQEMKEKHGEWGEHPDYDRERWAYEVMNGDTQVGYWEWVFHGLVADGVIN